MQTSLAVIKVDGLNKIFKVAAGPVHILKDISFEIFSSEFAIIYGPSGCGKSTLLHTILGLENPTSGSVLVLGQDIFKRSTEDTLAEFRKKNIGMVYQQANWIKSLNVIENVALPLALMGITKASRLEKARQMLQSVQMDNWANYHPTELSSGQQQKVALARALITDPQIIIADEPTGNLDFQSGTKLMSLLRTLRETHNKTLVMVTHDLEYLRLADKAIHLFDGKVKKIYAPNHDPLEMNINSNNFKKEWLPSQS